MVNDASTDVFLYALESNSLVETDRMIRSLSKQLARAKEDLEPHNLVEVRAGKGQRYYTFAATFRPSPNSLIS